jgi:hypothetical protein
VDQPLGVGGGQAVNECAIGLTLQCDNQGPTTSRILGFLEVTAKDPAWTPRRA